MRVCLGLLFSVLILAGCGKATEGKLTETDEVVASVACLNDLAMDEKSFQGAFVAGTAPKNRAAYFSSAIEVTGSPVISGDGATVTVKISQGNSSTEGVKNIKVAKIGSGEVTWKLKKEENSWKIQDAPLP